MKAKILSFVTASALLLGINSSAFASNDSTKVSSTEQRIEKSAKELAAESIELATATIKQAKENSQTLKTKINRRLDDTIINGKAIKEKSSSESSSNEYMNLIDSRRNHELAMMDRAMIILERIGEGVACIIIIIILLIIISTYLKRRQKYKIIEKAIENNYPLPPGFLGKNLRPTTTTVQHIHYTQEQSQKGYIAPNSKKITQEFNVTDWANFRSGIKWCAWGISIMWFFLLVDAPVWVFAIIPTLIGAAKLFVAYKLRNECGNIKTTTEQTTETTATPPPFQDENKAENN